jgi:hypothetical protein
MKRIALLLATTITSSVACYAQEVLRYDIAKGTRHEFVFEIEVQNSSDVPELEMNNTTSSRYVVSLQAIESVLGKLTLDIAIDSSTARSRIGEIDGIRVAGDSVQREWGLPPVRYTILPSGSVVSTTVSAPGAKFLPENGNPIGIVFPSTPVEKGASWTTTVVDSMPTSLGRVLFNRMRKFTVQRFLDTLNTRCVVLSLDGSSGAAAGTLNIADSELTIDGDEATTGLWIAELSSGLPVFVEISTTTRLRLAVGGMMSIIVPINIDRHDVLRRRK